MGKAWEWMGVDGNFWGGMWMKNDVKWGFAWVGLSVYG